MAVMEDNICLFSKVAITLIHHSGNRQVSKPQIVARYLDF